MSVSVIDPDGQTVIPEPVRRRLGLKPGDRLRFLTEAEGTVRLVPVGKHIGDLVGLLGRPPVPITDDTIDQAVTDAVLERMRRSSEP